MDRLVMFVESCIDALHYLCAGNMEQAANNWWLACFWLVHGRWPTTQEYKDRSNALRERNKRDSNT